MPVDANSLAADHPLLIEIDQLFAAHLSGVFLEDVMLPEVYKALVASLQGATREEILTVANDVTQLLVEQASETTRRGIAQTLMEGLEKQWGVDKTGRMLRETIGLSPSQAKQLINFEIELEDSDLYGIDEIIALLEQRRVELIADRAKSIAHTEMRNAVEEGENLVAQRRGFSHKVNVDSGDDRVSDICLECTAEGPIPIDANFPSGRAHPPHHPNCRCSAAYLLIETTEQLVRAEARADARTARIEKARADAEAVEDQLSLA